MPRFTVEIVEDIDTLAADWTRLIERSSATPYQSHAYLSAWARHVAGPSGVEIRVGVARGADDEVAAILPFGTRRGTLGRVGVYLGGSHVNLNQPIIATEVLRSWGASAARDLLESWCREAGARGAALVNQPVVFRGDAHPFAVLPATPSADRVPCIEIAGMTSVDEIGSSRSRRTIRSKATRFAAAGARVLHASTAAEVDFLLSAYLAQKARQFEAMGVDDPFSEDGVADFLRAAAVVPPDAGGFTLSGLLVDGQPIAVQGSLRHRGQRSAVILSYDASHPLARLSPGETLAWHLLEEDVAGDTTLVELGIGEGQHKASWANHNLALFDSFFASALLGHAEIGGMRLRRQLEGRVKGSPRLYGWIKTVRARRSALFQFAGRSSHPDR